MRASYSTPLLQETHTVLPFARANGLSLESQLQAEGEDRLKAGLQPWQLGPYTSLAGQIHRLAVVADTQTIERRRIDTVGNGPAGAVRQGHIERARM